METPQRQPGLEHEMSPEPEYMPRFPGAGRLKDKVALITGGDSGIGRATAILYAREGASIAIVYRDETEDAEKTAALVEEEGGRCLLIKGDVADKDFCEKAVSQSVEKLGKLDVVVANAAEQHAVEEFENISEEQLKRTFQTNIFGYFFILQAAMPYLNSDAAIVCTTSVTAYRGQDLLLDYSSTKGAILALVRALASKLADKNIRVNGVAPGPIWTPLIPASFPADKVERFGKDSPLGRPGQPNEVAPCFLFLACQDSSYMTGQVLHPNGGEPISG
ncbi:SDR family oxidoreductase [Ahrensia marina]|uniref:Short-chain dehydrogenase n=1 Tax=Ahrensia marina TaxID=1514904 RepID=A0A0M9GPV5_9HYPH|nr:SDR family oxidoreductase [Ahrensia marina]KPB02903.1 short-chain dehydrogenase [Ahrensia marina]